MNLLVASIASLFLLPQTASKQLAAGITPAVQLPYIVLGGDTERLEKLGLSKVKDAVALEKLAKENKYELVQDAGFYFVLHSSLTEPSGGSDLQIVLNQARIQKLPAVVKSSDSPDVSRALQSLMLNTGLGFDGMSPKSSAVTAPVIQVAVVMSATITSKGKSLKIQNLPLAKAGTWAEKSQLGDQSLDIKKDRFEFTTFCSPSIPLVLGKKLVARAIAIADELEQLKKKPIHAMAASMTNDYLSQYGKPGWFRKPEFLPEDFPPEIAELLIFALKSSPEMNGKADLAEGLFRSSRISNFSASIYLNSGVSNGGGQSLRWFSLKALLGG